VAALDVGFTVSRSGRTLKRVGVVTDEVTCSNGRNTSFLFEGWPWRLRVARDGSFSGAFALPQEALLQFTVSEETWLSGTFIRRGKAARVVVRARSVGEGGTVCDTGDRHITLRRQRPGFGP
jgi:hypothetical protein